MIREIVVWPDSVLNRKCEPIEKFDETTQALLADMADTMIAARGAGLAAPQIGYALRAVVILVKHPEAKADEPAFEIVKLCNPVIVERKGMTGGREGCLSLPGFFDTVQRSMWVKVKAQDENGNPIEIEGTSTLARALQHEIEHLDGVVFVQHLSQFKRNQLLTKFKKAKAKGMRYRSDAPAPQDFTKPLN